MGKYEIAVLYHPDLEIDLDKAVQKVTKTIANNKGKIVSEDNWGKRKLAYKIRGQDHGIYVFYNVEMPAEAVRKVESNLNITDEVIRFLITKPDIKAMAKAEAIKAGKKAKREAAKEKKNDENTESSEEPKSVKTKTVKPKKTSDKEGEE